MNMKDIPGFEGRYAVTKEGQVWSHPKVKGNVKDHKGMWLKQRITHRKYLFVNLQVGSSLAVHRLVLLTFMGDAPGMQANHKNGIKTDNRLENLEWVTGSENRSHAWRTGLIKNTENRNAAALRRAKKWRKLTDEQAADVRMQVASGVTQTDVARNYGVDRRAIYKIINFITYRGVQL
jgi:HNH endonuclease/NUMOD4 motif